MKRELHIVVHQKDICYALARSLRRAGFDARAEWANEGAVVVVLEDGFDPMDYWPGWEEDAAKDEERALRAAQCRVIDAIRRHMLRRGAAYDFRIYTIY